MTYLRHQQMNKPILILCLSILDEQ
jgi:hypothetical protein